MKAKLMDAERLAFRTLPGSDRICATRIETPAKDQKSEREGKRKEERRKDAK
jgi:hypothetical protein